MNTKMSEPCETANTEREPKFQELLNQAFGINGVIDHLKELHSVLGIIYEDVPQPEDPKKSSEPTLVRMLDELPAELSMAHSKIHDMINVTMNQLN